MSILNNIFENVLFTTFTSSIITLIILLIRYILKAKINMRLNQVLLTIIILKFCLVIVPESSISIFNLLPQFNTKNTISESLSTMPEDIQSQQPPNYSIEKITQNNYNKDEQLYDAKDNVDTRYVHVSMKDVLSITWLSGLLIILIGASILQLRFNNRLKLCREIDDDNVLNIVDKCKRTLEVKSDVKIYMEGRFKSPFIIGLFAPRIYIPQQLIRLESKDLEHIIMHELAHFKRKDLIYNIISVMAIAVNWFNPLIWKITGIIRADIELACDSFVLNKLGEDKAISYGKSMLAVARIIITGNRKIGLACYFSNTNKQLERRIKMISKFTKKTYKFTAVSLSVALLFGGVVLTGPVKAKTQDSQVKYVNEADNKDIVEKILINKGYKRYSSLERLLEDVNHNIMIPEYMPDNYDVNDLQYYPQVDRTIISYKNANDGNIFNVEFNISKTEPKEYLTQSNTIVDKYYQSLDGIKGEVITTTYTKSSLNLLSEHFTFKKDGTYYDIIYKQYKDDEVYGQLPISEVVTMINSLKDAQEINKDNFVIDERINLLYNMKDLENAREFLGYDFKVPTDNSFGKYMDIELIKDQQEIIFCSEGGFSIIATKQVPYYFDQFTKNDKLQIADDDEIWFDKMQGKWENIDNRKVLKTINTYQLLDDQTEPDKDINYYWCDDGVYYEVHFYSFTFQGQKIDMKKIVNGIMEFKSFDDITR